MAEELDIFKDTTAEERFIGFDTNSAEFQDLANVMDPSYNDQNGDGIPDHWNQELSALHTNHRGYIGDDGAIYRKELTYNKQTGEFEREYTDERLYFWTEPQELGDRGLHGDAEAASAGRDKFGAAGLYTEAEIKEAFHANQGMGYLKEANPDLTWDSYWDFIQKTTDLFTDSEYNDMVDGNMSAGNFQESPEYMALLAETGIKTQYVNDDGDVFNWNGTGYSKDFKVDDSIGIDVINSVALGLIGGFVAGPLIASALTPTLGAAGAAAASSAIVSTASQYMTTGEVDFGEALISAATAYGGAKLGDALKGSGALGEIGKKVSGVTDKFEDFVTQGNSIANAAIKAGGMSMLTQFVTSGEVDLKSAGIAALMAGGAQGFSEWTTSMYDAGEPVGDELLQEITVEAKRVGNDLGNGMYELDGIVFSENGYVGNMKDLDLDGDGQLSGNDLQYVDVTATPVSPTYSEPPKDLAYLGDFDGQSVYSDPNDPSKLYFQDGTVAATLDPNDPNRYSFKNPDGSEKAFGSLAEFGLADSSGVINVQAQADQGFLENSERAIYNPESDSWISTGDPGNVAPENVAEHGYWVVRGEDGVLYVTNGYMKEKYVGGYDNLDLSKNPYLVDEFNSRDPVWQHVTNGGALPPAEPGTTGASTISIIKTEGTDEVKPEQPTKPAKADNQGADQTNQESTSAGQGSGPTQATGGQAGTSGASGGATGGASIGGQAGTSGIGSGGGFIPSAGAGTDTTGTQTTGDSTAQGTGVSATNTAGTGGGPAGTNAGTGQNGQTGASSGTATGTGDAGANTGADNTGTGQSIDIGFGVSFGEDSGTGGVTGGGAGEVAGGGTGDSPGTGTGSGGAGLGTGSSGGAISGMGKPASFQGMMAGLSYEPQPIPGIISTPQTDYAADLEELIARQLSKRGMFT